MPIKDITGQRFGRFVVVEFSHTEKGSAYWNCICDCGKHTTQKGGPLRDGRTLSCGCYHREERSIHGYSARNPENEDTFRAFKAYKSMLSRVKPDSKYAKNYHDRGISITDPRWLVSPDNFMDDMGPCPKGMSLDRIDNNKGYCKDNCRWATDSEQQTNKRGVKITPVVFGEIKRAIIGGAKDTHIAKRFGLQRSSVRSIRTNKADYCFRPEYQHSI